MEVFSSELAPLAETLSYAIVYTMVMQLTVKADLVARLPLSLMVFLAYLTPLVTFSSKVSRQKPSLANIFCELGLTDEKLCKIMSKFDTLTSNLNKKNLLRKIT